MRVSMIEFIFQMTAIEKHINLFRFQVNATTCHVERVLAGPSFKSGDSLRNLANVNPSSMAVAKVPETYSRLRKSA